MGAGVWFAREQYICCTYQGLTIHSLPGLFFPSPLHLSTTSSIRLDYPGRRDLSPSFDSSIHLLIYFFFFIFFFSFLQTILFIHRPLSFIHSSSIPLSSKYFNILSFLYTNKGASKKSKFDTQNCSLGVGWRYMVSWLSTFSRRRGKCARDGFVDVRTSLKGACWERGPPGDYGGTGRSREEGGGGVGHNGVNN